MELVSRIKSLDKNYKYIMSTTLLFGIFAHGYMMLNNISYNDDVANYFSVGATYKSGRWALGILSDIVKKLVGGPNVSLHWFKGLISLILIGLSGCILASLYHIRGIMAVGLSGVMVTFPVITGTFGYLFTAPFYMFALLLCVMGAGLICRGRSWIKLTGSVLICISVGIYQAYLTVAISVCLIYFFVECHDREMKLKTFIAKACTYLICLVTALLLYLGANKISLFAVKEELLDYQGINHFGMTDAEGYISRIGKAYMEFIAPNSQESYNMYPMSLHKFYIVLLGLFFVLAVTVLAQLYRKNVLSGIFCTVITLLVPLSVNFIFVMCGEVVHSLMMYGQVMVYVFMIVLADRLKEGKTERGVRYVLAAVMLSVTVLYSRYANLCYAKAEMLQEHTKQYFNELINRVQSVEGYTPNKMIMFVNADNKRAVYNKYIAKFDGIVTVPYDEESIVNSHSWLEFAQMHNGWTAGFMAADEEFAGQQEVVDMSVYPQEGSIKLVGKYIVVKFG